MLTRQLDLTRFEKKNFFLWGPRKTGKSTLLKEQYQDALYIDLLHSDVFLHYMREPWMLRQELAGDPTVSRVVIDEVQKVPKLLDEVHWLIENTSVNFCLCGSSARKLKRGQANMLGGRALKAELFGLVSAELHNTLDLDKLLRFGYLPQHYLDETPQDYLRSYISDYLKEEIAAEGLVRNIQNFSDFLFKAAFSDTSSVNASNIARESGVSSQTVKEYFEILIDTLLGRWVPAYTKRAKRKVKKSPKFYFADTGVVNFLTKTRHIQPESDQYGRSFENFICHELHAHASYSNLHYDIRYWQTATGIEVDFILEDMDVAIEVKSSTKTTTSHLKTLRQLGDEFTVRRRILLCRENKKRVTSDGIEIYPYQLFLEELWAGEIIQ